LFLLEGGKFLLGHKQADDITFVGFGPTLAGD